MMTGNKIQILILGLLISLSSYARHEVPSSQLPQIGSRVRVGAPKLAPGWHVGMLNRLRVEPVCYVILIFESSNKLKASLTLNEITEIQLSNLYDKGFGGYDPGHPLYPDEEWTEVSLEALRAANKCRKP
jgi:hypothetical protein